MNNLTSLKGDLNIPIKVTKITKHFIWLDDIKYPINKIPSGITIDGNVDFIFSHLIALPDNLTINGYLFLTDQPIKSLPNNLVVKGSLDISYTKIKFIPDNLKVCNYLNLLCAPIKALPDNLQVDGDIIIHKRKKIKCSKKLRKQLKYI